MKFLIHVAEAHLGAFHTFAAQYCNNPNETVDQMRVSFNNQHVDSEILVKRPPPGFPATPETPPQEKARNFYGIITSKCTCIKCFSALERPEPVPWRWDVPTKTFINAKYGRYAPKKCELLKVDYAYIGCIQSKLKLSLNEVKALDLHGKSGLRTKALEDEIAQKRNTHENEQRANATKTTVEQSNHVLKMERERAWNEHLQELKSQEDILAKQNAVHNERTRLLRDAPSHADPERKYVLTASHTDTIVCEEYIISESSNFEENQYDYLSSIDTGKSLPTALSDKDLKALTHNIALLKRKKKTDIGIKTPTPTANNRIEGSGAWTSIGKKNKQSKSRQPPPPKFDQSRISYNKCTIQQGGW